MAERELKIKIQAGKYIVYFRGELTDPKGLKHIGDAVVGAFSTRVKAEDFIKEQNEPEEIVTLEKLEESDTPEPVEGPDNIEPVKKSVNDGVEIGE